MQIRLLLVWCSVTFVALAVTGGCGGDDDPARSNAELRIAIASDPTSLDPALITDLFSANVALNLMDPLVRLNNDLEPESALAESWLAFALDRTSLVENVTKAGEQPATSVTPAGMPGFDAIAQDYLPREADIEAARRYLDRASSPKRTLNLLYWTGDPAGGPLIAVAVQAMWKQLGLRTRVRGLDLQEFLALSGPPMDASVDVVWTGWIGDFVDDINFLELFTCRPGNKPNGYCDADYDRLLERARSTPNDVDRNQIYAQAEAMLTGPGGALPVIPAYWATFPTMRKPGIDGWRPNLLGLHDFTEVSVAER